MTSFWPRRIMTTIVVVTALLAATGASGKEEPWWLNVFFLIDGEWTSGREIHGWSPRKYGSEAECAERKAYAETRCEESPLDYPARWICSPGEPMKEPPEELRGTYC